MSRRRLIIFGLLLAVGLPLLVWSALKVQSWYAHREEYSYLRDFVEDKLPAGLPQNGKEGFVECYLGPSSMCPSISYIVAEDECLRYLKAMKINYATCSYGKLYDAGRNKIQFDAFKANSEGYLIRVWLYETELE